MATLPKNFQSYQSAASEDTKDFYAEKYTPVNRFSEPLFSIEPDVYEAQYQEHGLQGLTQEIVNVAQEMLPDDSFSYESLRDGTAPILLDFPEHLRGEKSDEAILAMFTNAKDFGLYSGESNPKARSFAGGVARAAPEAVAGGYGFTKGVALATPIANMIPPLGLPGLLAKGAVLLGGGVTGSMLAAFAADEAEEALIGKEDFILPSLRPSNVGGQATVYGLSTLHAPWTMVSKNPKLSRSSVFLENYRNVANGKFASKIDDAAELTAKNAGLSPKAYDAALNARKIKESQGMMFGLGFGRVNPKGKLFDPTLGPLGERVADAAGKGVSESLSYARDNKGKFFALESVSSGGAGLGAAYMQQLFPDNENYRLFGEVIGSGVVPVIATTGIRVIPAGASGAVNIVNRLLGRGDKGLVDQRITKESAERILRALELTDEYQDSANPQNEINTLIKALMAENLDGNGISINPDGSMTTATLAEAVGLPFSKSLKEIEAVLAKSDRDLSVAGNSGREQLKEAAKLTILAMAEAGDPMAVQAAGRLQQMLYEQSIIDQTENVLSSFYDSAERVIGTNRPGAQKRPEVLTGGKVTQSNRTELSESLYSILENQLDESKRRMEELYKEVGNFTIDTFVDADGLGISQPNILELMNTRVSEGGLKAPTATGAAAVREATPAGFTEDMNSFNAYFNPEVDELGNVINPVDENPVTLEKLRELRKSVMDKAAELSKNGTPLKARYMSQAAEALRLDIEQAAGSAMASGKLDAYVAANAYAFAHYNVFTRSFLRDLQVTDKNRGMKLDPKMLGKELFAGSTNDTTALRMEEIVTSVKFGVDHGLDPKIFDQMATEEALDLLIRDSLLQFVEPVSAARLKKLDPSNSGDIDASQKAFVNEAKLEAWRKQPGTQELFAIFPDLEVDTRTVTSAKNLYDSTISGFIQDGASDKTKAFQTALQYGVRPGPAIGDALKASGGNKPQVAMNELYNLIDQGPEALIDPITGITYSKKEAFEGFKNSILDYAVTYSGGSGPSFNPTAFFDKIFSPVKGTSIRQDFTVAKFMQNKGLMSEDQLSDMRKALQQMRNVEEAYAAGKIENALFKSPTTAKLLQARILGATLGVKAQNEMNNMLKKIGMGTDGNTMGGGLIAAEAGSEAIVNLLITGPESQRQKILVGLFSDPKALGALLKDISNEKERKTAMRTIEGVFEELARQTGRRVPYIEEYGFDKLSGPEEEQAPEPSPERSTKNFDNILKGYQNTAPVVPVPVSSAAPPPQSQVNPVQVSSAPLQPRPPVSAAPQNPENRARFAALFPNDSASAMIRQQSATQGIGSLAG